MVAAIFVGCFMNCPDGLWNGRLVWPVDEPLQLLYIVDTQFIVKAIVLKGAPLALNSHQLPIRRKRRRLSVAPVKISKMRQANIIRYGEPVTLAHRNVRLC